MRSALMLAALAACLAILIPAALGQNPPINPAPGFGQVPQGAGACSVEKSCADLAPLMIQSALDPSPLENNLRELVDLAGGQPTGPAVSGRGASWGGAD